MPTNDQTNLICLLDCAEELSRLQNPAEARQSLALGVQRALGAYSVLLYRVRFSTSGLVLTLLGWGLDNDGNPHWEDISGGDELNLGCDPLLGEALSSPTTYALARESDEVRVVFAIGPLGEARWLLEVHAMKRPERALLKAAAVVMQCFENNQQTWEYANLDTLTRLLNRKTFDTNFEQLIAVAERAERNSDDRRQASDDQSLPCWLAVFDIDHFKRINDSFGHQTGDRVLAFVGELLDQVTRAADFVFRYGGEEFAILVPETPTEPACILGERIRAQVEARSPDATAAGPQTVSIGVAGTDLWTHRILSNTIVYAADVALYRAKEGGRNRVLAYAPAKDTEDLLEGESM